MKSLFKLILAISSALLCIETANAQTTIFVGPTFSGGFTHHITESTAFSVAADAGVKNYRAGGSLGWRIQDNQRLKISAEYLLQRIAFGFFVGEVEQWVKQGAISADYQYEIRGLDMKPQLELSGYLSHAPSKDLSTLTVDIVNAHVAGTFLNQRRIAGSRAGGISPGITISPWWGGRVGAEVNYDDVLYDKRYSGSEKNARGFGGTLHLSQDLMQNLTLGLSAAIRSPYEDYRANLAWTVVNNCYGRWVLGLNSDLVSGKKELPSTYNIGLSLNYFADGVTPVRRSVYKGDTAVVADPVRHDFLTWTGNRMILPQVLAVADEGFTSVTPAPVPSCTLVAPALITPIGNSELANDGLPHSVSVAANFSGTGLTFTLTPEAVPAGVTISIDPVTGVITETNTGGPNTVTSTVTASNCAGSVTSAPFTFGL